MSEPFSWMDEGQGMKGVWRTDGGKKERREGGKESTTALRVQLLTVYTHIHPHTHPHTYTHTIRHIVLG